MTQAIGALFVPILSCSGKSRSALLRFAVLEYSLSAATYYLGTVPPTHVLKIARLESSGISVPVEAFIRRGCLCPYVLVGSVGLEAHL